MRNSTKKDFLRILKEQPTIRRREIAEELSFSLSMVHICVKELRKEGLVIQQFGQDDRYIITPEGLEALEELEGIQPKIPKWKKKMYLEEEKVELKLNILNALKKDPCLSRDKLKELFSSTKWQIEHVIAKCHEEGLIMKVGGARKVLTRRGHEYLDSNY